MAGYDRARRAAIEVVSVENLGAAGDLANVKNELANAVQAIAGDAALSQQIKDYMIGEIPFRRDGGDQRDIWERLSNNSKGLVINTLNQQKRCSDSRESSRWHNHISWGG